MTEKDANITTYGAGQILCKEGEKSTDLFFIHEGEIEIIVADKETGQDITIGNMTSGSVAGIMSFMEGEPRNATIKAKTEVKCTVVKSMQREKLLEQVPVWLKALIKQLAGDLKRVNSKLIRLNEEHTMLNKKYNVLKTKVDGGE